MADKTVASLTSSTPTIDDLTISYDNADTSELKKTTWQLVRDLYKTYFDTIYASLSGGTFTGDISVPAEVYGAGWNGSNEVPTKNDLYDKIETLGSGSVATDAIWDAKGDLAVGTGANTASRLAVGTNGQTLVADSAEATGLKWSTPAGGGDVTKVGTPVNNQIGVWTGDGTLEGDAALTFDTTTDTLTTGIVNSTALTASELTATDASKNLVSLAVATYPSLAEIAYVKGVTSAIQTQLNAKGAGDMVLATTQTVSGLKTFLAGMFALRNVANTFNALFTNTNTADRTITLPDSNTIIPIISQQLTVSGPTAARTVTLPDANFTAARTDAAQTFTGTQTFSQQVMTNNAITATGNAATVPITSRISTVTNNSAATLTITLTTTSAVDGMLVQVRVLDFSAVAQTLTWVNTENGEATVPATSNGSTTLPRAALFQYNSATSKWRCIAS